MEDMRKLGRGWEEISSQFLSGPGNGKPGNGRVVQVATSDISELFRRLERLEQKIDSQGLAQEASYDGKPPHDPMEYNRYEALLQDLKRLIERDYVACGIMDKNGLPVFFDAAEEAFEQKTCAAYFTEELQSARETASKLQLGELQRLMVTTKRYHLFLQYLNQEKRLLICLLVKRNGNVGLVNHLLNGFFG